MLILTRMEGQKILIGDDITIVVTGLSGGLQVKLGIEAPRDIPVLREELLERETKASCSQFEHSVSGWPSAGL